MQKDQNITIAIDGFSSCGKSTLAKALAEKLGYIFIDSGAMYRGITLFALDNGCILNNEVQTDILYHFLPSITLNFEVNPETRKPELLLNGKNVEGEIRTPRVSAFVSQVAALKPVREKLVAQQREMGLEGGVVMDGRDIGSVVFPHAELKLFVTANIDTRVGRRHKELTNKGIDITFDDVKENLLKRDQIDSTRKESPLIQAEDAIVIDNTFLTPEEQLHKAYMYVLSTKDSKLTAKNDC